MPELTPVASEVRAVIENAARAVAGDPAAREHVLGRLLRRAGVPSVAPGPVPVQAPRS